MNFVAGNGLKCLCGVVVNCNQLHTFIDQLSDLKSFFKKLYMVADTYGTPELFFASLNHVVFLLVSEPNLVFQDVPFYMLTFFIFQFNCTFV